MKRLLTLVALAATLTASAQVKVVKLWDNASAPHSNEDAGPQKEKNGNLYNTVDTELFIYPTAPDEVNARRCSGAFRASRARRRATRYGRCGRG